MSQQKEPVSNDEEPAAPAEPSEAPAEAAPPGSSLPMSEQEEPVSNDEEAAAQAEPSEVEAETAPPEAEPAGQALDPTAIRIETKALTVDVLVQRMAEGGIDLAPAAAGPVWDGAARSRLVESLLLRLPLPAFYLDASTPERWLVIDGLHRLAALDTFVNGGDLALAELEFLDHLAGKTFAELPRHFQRRILESQVTAHLIQEGTPEPVRAAIARRIKAGREA